MTTEHPPLESTRLDLNAALASDPRRFLAELKSLIQARMGFADAARHMKLNRKSLYRALSPRGNPRLDTLERVVHLLGFRFSLVPLRSLDVDDPTALHMLKKYVWWKTPRAALQDEAHFIAQMMTMGSATDVRWLSSRYSTTDLRQVLRAPPVGIFDARSWHYWHKRLGISPIPPRPTRGARQ